MKYLLTLFALVLGLGLAAPTATLAVEPDEILADPALEERARELSKDLRCLVCRNENIDESNADLARDLRIFLRERLTAGDSDDEAIEAIVSRYGEYVLLNPKVTGSSLMLWLAGPVALICALVIGFTYVRGRSGRDGKATETQQKPLSDEEQARLDEILKS
ncbi:cytochrome c-type biogenesis protein CcmH [Halocynthiibacter sp. C4]|uniref:cytochrome c-type biogenesis protein n=1 Tax=Halocynthiibacter sp. C4 TaxID=2992758 RepID=UPI00237B1838|nr:cytochrome c-type biogenesis protein [Halocynthiibacter sp. C4]MDE0589801.1 cytochrome c-type biogenesis protein CcmH [Halocynthiibacter sp. C4]